MTIIGGSFGTLMAWAIAILNFIEPFDIHGPNFAKVSESSRLNIPKQTWLVSTSTRFIIAIYKPKHGFLKILSPCRLSTYGIHVFYRPRFPLFESRQRKCNSKARHPGRNPNVFQHRTGLIYLMYNIFIFIWFYMIFTWRELVRPFELGLCLNRGAAAQARAVLPLLAMASKGAPANLDLGRDFLWENHRKTIGKW